MVFIYSWWNVDILAGIVSVHEHFLIWWHRNSLGSNEVIWKLHLVEFSMLLVYHLLVEVHGLLCRVLTCLWLWLGQATQANVLGLALEHWILLVEILVFLSSAIIMIHAQRFIKSLDLRWLNMFFELKRLNSLSLFWTWWWFLSLCHLLFQIWPCCVSSWAIFHIVNLWFWFFKNLWLIFFSLSIYGRK